MRIIKIALSIWLFATSYGNGQSFQRMAVAKGVYKLPAGGTQKITAYCLDYTRSAPAMGMNYGNLLTGGASAKVRFGTDGATVMPLRDAIAEGHITVEGASVLDGRGLEILKAMSVETTDPTVRREINEMITAWPTLPKEQQREVESGLASMLPFGGDHTGLSFKNNTGQPAQIFLNENIQLGSVGESQPVTGVERLKLLSNPRNLDEHDAYNKEVWKHYTEQQQASFKTLGEYRGPIDGNGERLAEACRSYQAKHELPATGEFDPKTEKHLQNALSELDRKLSTLGFESGELPDKIRALQQAKNANTDGVASPSFQSLLEAELQSGRFYANGKRYETTWLDLGNGKQRFLRLNGEKNLLTAFNESDLTRLDDIYRGLEARRYVRDEIEVVSLVSDEATNANIRQLFPGHSIEFNAASLRQLKMRLEGSRKSLFVIGHIEGVDFVTRNAKNEEVFRIGIADLKALGDALGINVFPLGCNSAKVGSGVANVFNTVDAVQRLHNAVADEGTVAGLLKGLSGDELIIVVNEGTLGDLGYLQARLYHRSAAALAAGALVGGGMFVYSATNDTAQNK